jgi:hypothetical protein
MDDPRTTCTMMPKGRTKSTQIGKIQWDNVPVPEVGSQESWMANTTIATIASQKSGTDAPISETMEEKRSKKPPVRNAASEPTTMAQMVTNVMVMTASHKVQVKASRTTSRAGRALRRLSPRSPVMTLPTY